MKVAVVRRNAGELASLTKELGAASRAYACDATDEGAVQKLFPAVASDLGAPVLVVYNAAGSIRKGILETTAAEFERCWKNVCMGGFLVGREAARAMLGNSMERRHRGTIVFTGATGSLRGGANFVNMAVGKFGLRAVAQSMAREFQPQGIHVAHTIIDGQIESDRPGRNQAERGADSVLNPNAIAEAYYQLHLQSPSAWTLELDLRPYVEKF
jgi:NAD(P)-dependent dehydrogenase (short-subunit alcohol dehydrogenase family)